MVDDTVLSPISHIMWIAAVVVVTVVTVVTVVVTVVVSIVVACFCFCICYLTLLRKRGKSHIHIPTITLYNAIRVRCDTCTEHNIYTWHTSVRASPCAGLDQKKCETYMTVWIGINARAKGDSAKRTQYHHRHWCGSCKSHWLVWWCAEGWEK